ncbi:MAG: nitrogen fixation protein NifQ [Magnetococcales bacterium]|nr:nitrogen fixation protein NifQ [Magnetococcales bacterium]
MLPAVCKAPGQRRPTMELSRPGVIEEALPFALRQEALSRTGEVRDLVALFLEHRVDASPVWDRLAWRIALGCLGGNHLWQDLGLSCREELTAMLQRGFPSLVARNASDMKWKKFFYRQLCEREGVGLCRAPTCQVCRDYDRCFGPEI